MTPKLRLLLSIACLACLAPTSSPAVASDGGRLIAPPAACPGQSDLVAAIAAQQRSMRCMTEFARRMNGLGELGTTDELNRSARDKTADILRCDSFSHFACGREFTYWMRRTDYISTSCWQVGENLAWGMGVFGTVRSIFRAWMRSPEHRTNILGDYDEFGVSLQVGDLGGRSATRVWAEHFGARCAPTPP